MEGDPKTGRGGIRMGLEEVWGLKMELGGG